MIMTNEENNDKTKKIKIKHISQIVPDKAMDSTATVEKKKHIHISVIDHIFAFAQA